MAEIMFSIPELRHGIDGHMTMARKFLQPDLTAEQINKPLMDISNDMEVVWRVKPDRPLRTRISHEHKTGVEDKRDRGIYAEISFEYSGHVRWKEKPRNGPRPQPELELTKNGVISIDLFCKGNATRCRHWKFDIAPRGHSVGSLLHVDLDRSPQGEHDRLPQIPRLVSFVITPADAIEFVLSELFPQTWKEHRENEVGRFGRAIQSHTDRMVVLANEYMHKFDSFRGWPGVKASTKSFLSETIS